LGKLKTRSLELETAVPADHGPSSVALWVLGRDEGGERERGETERDYEERTRGRGQAGPRVKWR